MILRHHVIGQIFAEHIRLLDGKCSDENVQEHNDDEKEPVGVQVVQVFEAYIGDYSLVNVGNSAT